jgi:hypothetical protein
MEVCISHVTRGLTFKRDLQTKLHRSSFDILLSQIEPHRVVHIARPKPLYNQYA